MKLIKAYSLSIFWLGAILGFPLQNQAAFILVDGFSNLGIGSPVIGSTASNGNTWGNALSTGENFNRGVDDNGNTVLANLSNGSSGPFVGLTSNILTDTQSTLFLRINIRDTDLKSMQVAFSDSASPGSPGDEKTVALSFNNSNGLSLLNGPGAGVSIATDTWYNVWLEVDTNTNTYDGFIQGGAFATRTIIDTGATFRDYTDGTPLQSLLLRANSSQTGNIWFDDIYVDTAGFNSSHPVPEPSTVVLLVAGTAALLLRRRA